MKYQMFIKLKISICVLALIILFLYFTHRACKTLEVYQRNYKKEAQIGKSNSFLSINFQDSQAHILFHQYKNVQHQNV